MTLEQITYAIRGCIYQVHKALGPGLLETIYEETLEVELRSRGLKVERQVNIPVIYKGKKLPTEYRVDMLVEGRVVVELKSVESLQPVHYKQLLSYLRLTDLYVGVLVNFNTESIDRQNYERMFNSRATHKE